MSVFRVNNNTLAMSALRNLQATGMGMSDSMQKLSTGLRINNAGDDPAGLIVSEGLRAQISGIDQALRNNQDAINYSKTAEAALDEVSRLLRDARSLSVASGNSATLDDNQRLANQNQLNSIVQSISRISETTAFGRKKLLDGSSGTTALSTSAGNVTNMSFSGTFNAMTVNQNSTVTVDMVTSAERAKVTTTASFALGTTTVNAGSFTINGVTFSTTTSDTIQDVMTRINGASRQTGVNATWNPGGTVSLSSNNYGANAQVNLVDSTGILMTQAGAISDIGVNAVADVTIDINGATAGGLQTVSFASGDGLTLRDIYGNAISLSENGNLQTAAAAWGTVTAGNATFQVGGNANETTSLSLGNFAASELGKGVISSKNLSSINIMTAANATEALQIIDKAIDDVSSARGAIGNFMRNILESNTRSLSIQRENLSATESNIRDVDVAAEMANYTRFQILQQSGVAMLAQANQAPQAVLRLLQG